MRRNAEGRPTGSRARQEAVRSMRWWQMGLRLAGGREEQEHGSIGHGGPVHPPREEGLDECAAKKHGGPFEGDWGGDDLGLQSEGNYTPTLYIPYWGIV